MEKQQKQKQKQQPKEEKGAKPKYDVHFTDRVIAATGPNANPRLAQIMPSLLRHLHDFAREVDLTVEEWMAGVEMINEAGRMSDSKRNETGMLCDVLGLESLVDEITSKQQQLQSSTSSSSSTRPGTTTTTTKATNTTTTPAAAAAITATPSAILGPFYRADVPLQPLGSSILKPPLLPYPSSSSSCEAIRLHASCLPLLTRMSGRIRSATTGAPIASAAAATLEVWQSAPNGLYEQQDPLQPCMNLRGRFMTTTTTTTSCSSKVEPETERRERGGGGGGVEGKDKESKEEEEKEEKEEEEEPGFYALTCLRPTAYPIPSDGPAGRLLGLLDRHPFRPSHLHFVVSAPGFRTLTTQLFDRADPYVRGDAVFAVKEELLVEFRPLPLGGGDGGGGGEGDDEGECYRPRWHLEYDFLLVEA